MTQSSTSQASDLPKQRPAKRPSPGRGRSVLTFIFRLLLLGVSGSLAALLGIVIAQFYPGQIQEPPLVEKFMQGSQALWRSVTRLPETWSSPTPTPTPNLSGSATPSSPQITTPPPPPPSSPSPLSEADRQRIQTELTQLQTELQQAPDRSAASAAIQQRLQSLQQQLNPGTTSFTTETAPDQSFIAPATSTIANGELLKVTLPSDALFNSDQTTLRPTTTAILDSIVTDLQRYPGATIRVAGHTDSQGSAEADRDRSFQQASAISQYLSGKLDDSYRWVAVGYGSKDPLVDNTSTINRQRNRRIEIVIDPN